MKTTQEIEGCQGRPSRGIDEAGEGSGRSRSR